MRRPPIEVTTTYLQMGERPRHAPPAPPVEGLHIVDVDLPAVPFYRDLYNRVGGEWLWYERRLLADGELRTVLHDPRTRLLLAFAAHEPAGFAELDARRSPDVEIAYFGLLRPFVGRRIGPWLMAQALERAWALGPSRVWLHTCTLDHPAALRFYEKMGFARYREEVSRIEDPRSLGV